MMHYCTEVMFLCTLARWEDWYVSLVALRSTNHILREARMNVNNLNTILFHFTAECCPMEPQHLCGLDLVAFVQG